ncbi:MAG TPA: DUF1595 domain-containing protein [Polyangia bacterium]|nr:DUF1595 domain-containing protein [Polyangia bacterium]
MMESVASSARVRLSLVAAVSLGMLGFAGCESAQDNTSAIGTVAGGEGVQIQRIDALEYDQAVQRSLGVTLSNDDRLSLIGHDGEMTPGDYQQHFDRVQVLVSNAFGDPALRSRIMTCAPTSRFDLGCAQSIIRQFGAVAWQRPVSEIEVAQLTQVASAASSLGGDFPQSIEQVVKTMMVSAPFLYRVQGV